MRRLSFIAALAVLLPFIASAQTPTGDLGLALTIIVLPLDPTNLSASTISSSRIDLAWDDNSNNEEGFYIEEGIGNNSIFTRIDSVGSNITTYSRTNLSANTDYFYRVQARNTAGTSGYTNEANSTTSATSNSSTGNSGGGGGGSGGGNSPPVPSTSATFLGRAYPKREVMILKDGQVAASTVAGADSQFNVALSGLSGGSYIFSLYSEDTNGNRSSLVTFPVSITAGAATQISGIFIAPTIAVDKTQVKQGDNLAIFGQSAPSSSITITIASDNEIFGKATADSSGVYLYNLDTNELEMGEHLARSKASLSNLNLLSPQSSAISFTVGTMNVLTQKKKAIPKGDSNKDGKVNLVDFSIMSYWFKRPKPPVAADMNGDGKVDLIDFSILAYNWTG